MPFKPGKSGNPGGRPKVAEIDIFRQAVAETEKEKKKSLYKHAAEQAYESERVLETVLKKLLPDKVAHEGSIETISPEQRQKEVDEVKAYLGEFLKK